MIVSREFELLQERIGYTFRRPELLILAFTHRSFAHENHIASYERLEFLGDAVLELVVSDLLMRRFPHLLEGDLTEARSYLVKGTTLAEVGESFELGRLIRLGRGESTSGGAQRGSTLADAVEALIGATYRDGGLRAARSVILVLLADHLQQLDERRDLSAKELDRRLALWARRRQLDLVFDTAPRRSSQLARVTIYANGTFLAEGKGSSLAEARATAARIALFRVRTFQAP